MTNQFFEPPDDEEAHHAYHSFLEKRMQGLLTPFEKFTQSQVTASGFLLLCAIIALIWSSIPSLTAS